MNITSGTTAKLSCIDNTTCVRISRCPVSRSPYRIVTPAAGMMASDRVASRRNHGGSRRRKNPSITACPASVAVTVEFRPQARSAMAKSCGAMASPSSGASNSCASPSSATSVRPVAWKLAAARIRIDALIISANISATVLSIVAYFSACRFSGRVSPQARVCTMAECRYRLCGITVAPRMPSARYSISGLVTTCTVGAKPTITAPQSGSARAIWMPKHTAMTPNRVITNASSQRNPLVCSHNIRNTSSAVMMTPISSGMPNSRFNPMAVPITSAMSVAMIASSAKNHSGIETQAG